MNVETKPKDLHAGLTMGGLVEDPAWSQSGKEDFPVVQMGRFHERCDKWNSGGLRNLGGDMASLES